VGVITRLRINNIPSLKDPVCKLILDIAHEADIQDLNPNEESREVPDLDSMDFMNLLNSIAKETGVNAPEND
jgi:acyl carrier protein